MWGWEKLSLLTLFGWCCSGVMIFGGVVPYIPQYRDIRRTKNTEGFSLYVCLALLVANTLRILFWFGHRFESPLLIQSIIMNFTMFAMVQMCIDIRNSTMIIKEKTRTISDFDWNYFWKWSDFESYLGFMFIFTVIGAILLYIFLDFSPFIEFVGFMSVFVEACLGVPQFYRNYVNKSTVGMSKKMVLMWTCGDIYKTTYFVIRNSPAQFWLCGGLQICIDVAILTQALVYRSQPVIRPKRISINK